MKKFFLLCLFVTLLMPWAVRAEVVTVNDGESTCTEVPIYANYGDYGSRSQFVVPASQLEDMANGSITAMKFYAKTASWSSTGTWEVYLKEVSDYSFSTTFLSRDDATMVWAGSPSVANSELNIEFDQAYAYGGGDLVIEFLETSMGNYQNFSWNGVSGNSVYKNGTYSDHESFKTAATGSTCSYVPKTQFTYTPGVPPTCPKPKTLAYSEVKNHSVQLAWAENGEATAWKIAYKKAADADYTIADADTNPFVLSGLDAETAYVAKVQADCGSEQSDFSNEVSFTTLVACPVPAFHADSIKNVMAHSADIYWGSDAENFKINYRTAAYVDGLEEHFDVSAIPSGWSRYTGLVDNVIAGTATLSSNTEWTTTTYGLGSYNAKLNIYGSSCKHWLLTPEFVFPAGGEFSFKIALTDYGNDNVIEDKTAQADDRFVVLVYADDKWTILREWNNSGSKYEYNSVPNDGETIDDIDLSEYEGKTIKIAFYGESTVGSNGDNDFHIDDVLVGIIYKAGDWNEKETSDKPFQLDGLDAETIYDIKVQALCGGIDGDSEESAIVQFTTISDCQTPDALVANNITASSAVLSWNGYGKSDFNLQYRVKGSEEPMTLKDGIQNNFLLEELLSNTVYEFQVQPTCAEAEAWSALFEFRTACGIYEAASWTDGFEDGIYCWTVGNLNAPTNTYYIPYVNSTSHEGTKALKIAAYRYSSTTNADSAYAVLPHFDYGVKGLAGHTLKFYARQESTGSTYNDHLLVGVVSDPADLSTFTQVADVQVSGTDYALYEVQLTNYTGSGEYLVLLAVTNPEITQYSRYASFYVDDIAIEETPACQPLASISISDVQRRSMVVTLHPKTGLDLGTYDLVYSKTELDNDALEAAEKKTVSAATDTIKGLDRETKYYVYVRANCDADGVSTWVSAEATTNGLVACDEIPVGDGTNSEYGPICGYYGYERNGYIFTPADGLSAGSISKIAWNYVGAATIPAKIYIKNTDATAFESTLVWNQLIADATLVYDASITLKAGWNEITFSAPFDYTGGNLMVLVASEFGGSGGGSASAFYSTSTNSESHFYIRKDNSIDDNAAYSTFSTKGINGNRHDIKITSCYELDPCPAVSDMAYELIDEGTTKANVSWTISDADYLSGFEYIRSTEPIDDFSEKTPEAVAENHIEFTDLEAGTHYYVYVRAICQAEGHDEGTSATWASVDFTTNADCPVVNNLQAELTGTNTVLVSWEPAYAEQDKKFWYAVTETELVNEPYADLVEDTTRIELALDNDKHYYIYVASKCGDAHSDYQMIEINTLPSCQAVENLAYTRLEHNLVEIAWNRAEFATETQWEVSVEGDDTKTQIVNDSSALIFGLQPETAYAINVKAICSDTESSAIASLDITTAAQPGNCKQVGTGTSSNYYTPLCTYNKYSWVQMIYPASEIGKSGEIQSIAFQVDAIDSSKDLAGEVNIYMAHTAKASHSSSKDWIAADDLKLVYHTDAWEKPTATGWMEMALETTFDYNGTDNLVIVMAAKLPDWSMSQKFNYTSATNSVLFRGSDSSTDADAYSSHPGSYAGTQRDDRPNIQLCFPAKACPDVVNLAVSGIDKHEATVSWEPMGSEVAWNVLISDKLLTEFDGAERIETLSKHFDTLEDDQDYYVYVQPADCDGADFSMISFVTLPSCKVMTSPAVKSETIDKHEATVYWVDPNAEKAGQYQVAYGLFSDFDLNDEATYELTDVVTDTFAVIDGLAPETKYAFAVKANCDGDDPSRWSSVANFTTLIGCYKPNTPSVLDGSITTNSATVYWGDEHDAAGYIVAYGLSNTFDIEDPNTYEVLNVTDTFAILPNLLAASTYKVRVKSDCGAEDGQSKDWSYASEFTTACGTFDLPFSEDFEEAITCWTMVDCESSTGRNSEAKMEGSYGFKFRYNLLPPQYLISPELVASDKPVKVEFYHKKGGSFTETFKVGYSTTTKDVTAFTWAEEVTSPSKDEWTRYADVLPASVKYVAIQYTANDQLSLYIDNFSVKEAVYNVTFAAEGAEGMVPAAQEVEEGQSIQMPVNKTLYVAGKTLTGWKAGEDTYAIGDDFTPAADVTLNAVFEDNTVDLLTADEAVIVKWIFGENAGAPSVHWEGNTGILVTQATIGEASIDVKLAIDATAGKFYNVGRADKWAQVNAGTIFAFPYKAGLTEEVDAYTNPASCTLGEGTLTVDANNYFSYLQITLPATPTALENTGIDTKAIKRLENGILVIELNGTKYNAQGMLIRK